MDGGMSCVGLHIHTYIHNTPRDIGQPMEWRAGGQAGSSSVLECSGTIFQIITKFKHGLPGHHESIFVKAVLKFAMRPHSLWY